MSLGKNGKGDRCRPYNKKIWDKNWVLIFGIKCPKCEGRGWVLGIEIKCPKCNGIGKIERK